MNDFSEEIRNLDLGFITIEDFYFKIFCEMKYFEFFKLLAAFQIYKEGGGTKYKKEKFLALREVV